MAAFTITIGPNTATKNISAGDSTRLLDAYKALYADKWFTPPVPPATQPVPFVPTSAQVFNELANGLFKGIAENVKSYERSKAAKTASDAIVDLPIT